MKNNKKRAFLKWAGGKYTLVEQIRSLLPEGHTLVEPFVGAGSVFLNTDFKHYLLNDINPDLINLYRILQQKPDTYIQDAERYFCAANNNPDAYYALRAEFNASKDPYLRSLLFLYMNRYGYNGLCRYNLSGIFNVPFGRYKAPYFPKAELLFFAEKAQNATFTCQPFTQIFPMVSAGSVIYCDPPYAPISQTARFTSYASNGFNLEDQRILADVAADTAVKRKIPVLISNHDTDFTREIYSGANISNLQVNRFISQKGSGRKKVAELMALYQPAKKQTNLSPNAPRASAVK